VNFISRKEAQFAGMKYYFTGQECLRGHISKRLVSTRTCLGCSRENDLKRYCRNIEREKARGRAKGRVCLPEPTRPCPTVCELCGSPPRRRALHLDHDHRTGAFRGWLCQRCNLALGQFGDNIEGLMRAVNYLQGIIYGQCSNRCKAA